MTLEELSQLATVVGAFSVPFAIFLFLWDRHKHRQARELATYTELAKEYRAFLQLCLHHTDLQIYDYGPDTSLPLAPSDRVKQMILFDTLVSMLETAYFQYRNHRSAFKKAQWSGWNTYMRDWCGREDFRRAWNEHLGAQYDQGFLEHMNALMYEVAPECPHVQAYRTATPK